MVRMYTEFGFHPQPFAPKYPEKTVTLARHTCPRPVPRTPYTLHFTPISAPFIPTNPPHSRNLATGLEAPVHPCYPR